MKQFTEGNVSNVRDRHLLATYGDALLEAGFTSIPNLILDAQGVVIDYDDSEMNLFFKTRRWNGRKVKADHLALGVSHTKLWRMKKRLQKLGHLSCKEFYKRSGDGKIIGEGTSYDWSGLISFLKQPTSLSAIAGHLNEIADAGNGTTVLKDHVNEAVKDNTPPANAGLVRVNKLADEDLQPYIQAWNHVATANALPKCMGMAGTRRRALEARIKGDADFPRKFSAALEIIPKCPWLLGTVKDSNWRVTFDFLLSEKNLLKILEGNYLDKRGNDVDRLMAEAEARDAQRGNK